VFPFFALALVGYGAAGLLYLAFVGGGLRDRAATLARAALGVGFLAHTADVGARCVAGLHPAASAGEALSFAAWLTAGAYLVLAVRQRLPIVGAFVAPAVIALLLTARLAPAAHAPPVGSMGVLGRIHVSLATAGVALFALAAAVAALYLLQESQLKRRQIGGLGRRGPPLETLDALNRRCVGTGFLLFTVALVTGAAWVARLPRVDGDRWFAYAISVVTWLAFGGLVLARVTAGWRGRRAAWLTLFGFAGAMAVVALYLLRHNVVVGA
jgi:ABC-type uncharacterized transport system permease subunit